MQTLSIFAGIVASNVRTEIHKVIEVLTIAFITIGMEGKPLEQNNQVASLLGLRLKLFNLGKFYGACEKNSS